MQTITRGPRTASVLLVGEAPGENEIREGKPFVGYSGKEVEKELAEAGFDPGEIRITNVCHERPKDNKISHFLGLSKKDALARNDCHYDAGKFFTNEILAGLHALRMEIDSMPNLELILGVGNAALWALTGEWGITKWRGSQMFAKRNTPRPIPFVPTFHPAGIQRNWEWRWQALMDYRRARIWREKKYAIPEYRFIIRPSFSTVIGYLDNLLNLLDVGLFIPLAVDLETREGHIACLGLARSARDAICIPFLTTGGPYWSVSEECAIVWRLYQLLTHSRIEVIGQNFLYDQQYLARRWGFKAFLRHDTMLKQHICLPGVPKGLDFISSQHCSFHCYWKDESKDWDPRLGEEQLWIYNCKDAVATFEANQSLSLMVLEFGHGRRLDDQMEDGRIALDMMLRGIRTDLTRKQRVADELEQAMLKLLRFINRCLGIELIQTNTLDGLEKTRYFNPASPKQVHSLAYKVLKLPEIWKRDDDGKHLTADKDAIKEWLRKVEPLYRPLLQAIMDFRSLQVFRSTFALAPLDHDGRWRCSINVAGPHTLRWSTGEDAFGFGTNMQNIPKGDEDE